jgi:hypothetical protein
METTKMQTRREAIRMLGIAAGAVLLACCVPQSMLEPTATHTVTTGTLSPQTLCNQVFSYRKEFSGTQRAMLDSMYQDCVNARTTPTPLGAIKQLLAPQVRGTYPPPFYSRLAGDGTIIEDSFTPLRSEYRIKNQWRLFDNEKTTMVYTGGVLKGDVGGEALLDELSWKGVLVIHVFGADQQVLKNESGTYYTPVNAGPVRIIDATGN